MRSTKYEFIVIVMVTINRIKMSKKKQPRKCIDSKMKWEEKRSERLYWREREFWTKIQYN